jgi:Cu2+-containing amine oxidase
MKNNITLIAASLSIALLAGPLAAGVMDPVSDDEISRAKSMALPSTANVAARRSLRVAADTEQTTTQLDITETPTIEFLRVQPHRFSKSEISQNKRWADSTAYDYTSDELITTVVDLDNNRVISTKRNRNMQPPMAESEIKRAIEIVFQDDEERSILNGEFTRITGQTLSSIDQLQYKAFTFFADSMPTVVNQASTSCGAQRCAQLMLYTHDNVVFEVSPIVNLSAGVVTQRLGY